MEKFYTKSFLICSLYQNGNDDGTGFFRPWQTAISIPRFGINRSPHRSRDSIHGVLMAAWWHSDGRLGFIAGSLFEPPSADTMTGR
jgi:hypothetical protein